MLKYLTTIPKLIRYRLSLAVTFSGAAGYVMYTGILDSGLLLTSAGIFVMAGGSSALNQFQEKRRDSVMLRTMSRPLVTGSLDSNVALIVALFMIISGAILLMSQALIPSLLGLLNVVLYNILYTLLKRVTYLAVLPGALVGAIPPIIGWTAGGGYIFDRSIVFVAFLILLWQLPHFWVLVIKYRQDYNRAGYPNILDKLDENQVRRIIFAWISVSSLFALSYPLFGITLGHGLGFALVGLNIFFILTFYYLLFSKGNRLKLAFLASNIFITLLFLIFAAGSLFHQ